MSRIRGFEAKVQKEVLQTRKNGWNEKETEEQHCDTKDVAENEQIAELVSKLPRLDRMFTVHRKIGEGTFSSVYLGSLRAHAALPDEAKRWFAIKHLVPTAHPARIEHELRCLKDMGGRNNVIGVDLCLRNLDTIVFVMPYIPHRKFSEYMGEMDGAELAAYMRALLVALRHVHSFGVIHRDVKPSNFLYDRENRRYLLVDFGLAQRVSGPSTGAAKRPPDASDGDGAPDTKRGAAAGACACAGAGGVCASCLSLPAPRAPRAGTQGFRPPEVLLKVPAQTTAVDVWACGVVLASVLCRRYPLFRAANDCAALAELADLLGTGPLQRAAAAMGRRLTASCARQGLCLRKLCRRLRGDPPATPAADAAAICDMCRLPQAHCLCRDETVSASQWVEGVSVCGFPDSAFALAAQLLEPLPARRPTAEQALQHPFLREDNAVTDQQHK